MAGHVWASCSSVGSAESGWWYSKGLSTPWGKTLHSQVNICLLVRPSTSKPDTSPETYIFWAYRLHLYFIHGWNYVVNPSIPYKVIFHYCCGLVVEINLHKSNDMGTIHGHGISAKGGSNNSGWSFVRETNVQGTYM